MTRTARSKAIRKAGKEARMRRANTNCPTPRRRSYPTSDEETVIVTALRTSRWSGRSVRIYTCSCGSLHIARDRRQQAERKAA